MPRPPSRGRVSSPFGWRTHPITGKRTHHNGEDTLGEGNFAPVTGRVVFAGWDSTGAGFGWAVGIQRAYENEVWWIAHHGTSPSVNPLKVKVGDWVEEGVTYLGKKGTTGASTAEHCHTECRINGNARPLSGVAVDPRSRYASPSGGGMEIIMSWDDWLPTRSPDTLQVSGSAPAKEILAYIEAYTKGMMEADRRNPANPEQLTGDKQRLARLVAFTEARSASIYQGVNSPNHGLSVIANTVNEVKDIVEQIGAPTNIEVTVPVASIKAALLDPEVIAAIQGPIIEMLNEIPTNGELGQALTSAVVLVNEHADENKDAIIAAMPAGSGGGSSSYNLSLTIDEIPGTATGTATAN